jgi:hypothetical protein
MIDTLMTRGVHFNPFFLPGTRLVHNEIELYCNLLILTVTIPSRKYQGKFPRYTPFTLFSCL